MQITDTNGNPVKVDSLSRCMVALEPTHSHIHDGELYVAADYVASASTRNLLFITGPAPVHMFIDLAADAKTTAILYEEPVVSANGTAVPSNNSNYNSANVATGALTHTPTITSNGTFKDRWLIGSSNTSGGTKRENEEKIFKPNTKYLLMLAGSTVGLNTRFIWYEKAAL